jgi:hypothetical protein
MKYIIALLFAFNANASILEINPVKKWNINGVPVGHEAVAMGTKLDLIGTGTAVKKMGLAKAKLFVVQMYAERPIFFIRNETVAINSIDKIGLTAIRMTFLRNIDGPTVNESITDYLRTNITEQEHSMYMHDISSIVTGIGVSDAVISGQHIDIVAYKHNLVLQNTKGVVTNVASNNNNLTNKVFSMFIGNTTDAESLSLKRQLLQDPVFTFGDKQ